MDLIYQNTNSNKTSNSWVNSIIKVNLEVHLTEWKNYCNLIQEAQPNTSKQENQLHQDLIHEIKTLQSHAKNLPHEPSKWFVKDITKFSELNTNSLEQWITNAKKVIRPARRKMKKDKQQQLTKFYPLQLTSKKNKRTIELITPPTPTKK